MKKVALSEVKDDLSRYLRRAEKEEVVITRHGKPAGVLIGFESKDDWFDYRLENDPRLLRRVEAARQSLRQGKGVRLEDMSQVLLVATKFIKWSNWGSWRAKVWSSAFRLH